MWYHLPTICFAAKPLLMEEQVRTAGENDDSVKGERMEKSEINTSRRSFLKGAGLALAGTAAVGLMGCAPSTSAEGHSGSMAPGLNVTPGKYTATGNGRNGDVVVTTTFSAETLDDIRVQHDESRNIGEKAIQMMRSAYLLSQCLNVDVVSGATLSAMAFQTAVEDCFKQAGADVSALKKADNGFLPAPAIDEECDVCIVGTGLAASAAAVEAVLAGADVIMLDKMPYPGGNTNVAEGQLNAPDPDRQIPMGIEDSSDKYFEDTYEGGVEKGDADLVRVLADNALDAVRFLERHGLVYRDKLFTAPGGLWCRAHFVDTEKAAEQGGSYYVTTLLAAAEHLGVRVFTDATVNKIETENGSVNGVSGARTSSGASVSVRSKSVILATGGYARNAELAMQYDARVTDDMMSSNVVSSTGDGIALATEVGADLRNMELVQIHPLGDPQNGGVSTYVGDWIGAEYFMFVNKEGKRFVAESERRDNLTNAELEQTDGCMYLIVDSAGLDPAAYQEEIDNLVETGHSVKADTVE